MVHLDYLIQSMRGKMRHRWVKRTLRVRIQMLENVRSSKLNRHILLILMRLTPYFLLRKRLSQFLTVVVLYAEISFNWGNHANIKSILTSN